jgi:hypothetical protein
MPNHSSQAIRDLAEIINRLWGSRTPGGRLYPAPIKREALVIGWSDGDTDADVERSVVMMRSSNIRDQVERPELQLEVHLSRDNRAQHATS